MHQGVIAHFFMVERLGDATLAIRELNIRFGSLLLPPSRCSVCADHGAPPYMACRPKPKATKEDRQAPVETGTATAERDPVQTPKHGGFFGLGGNGDGGGLAGFLGDVFGGR